MQSAVEGPGLQQCWEAWSLKGRGGTLQGILLGQGRHKEATVRTQPNLLHKLWCCRISRISMPMMMSPLCWTCFGDGQVLPLQGSRYKCTSVAIQRREYVASPEAAALSSSKSFVVVFVVVVVIGGRLVSVCGRRRPRRRRCRGAGGRRRPRRRGLRGGDSSSCNSSLPAAAAETSESPPRRQETLCPGSENTGLV